MPFTSYVEVEGVRCHVACWGRWIEETEPDEVIVCVPGNPGLIGFYFPYLDELHKQTGLPIWTICHAGHDEEPKTQGITSEILPIKGNEDKFDLNGQYRSKLQFLLRYTRPTTKIHLVGHSIGGWIAMELLKDADVGPRIATSNLLFPTVQDMALTPYGVHLTKVVRRLTWIVWSLLWIYARLPRFVQMLLIRVAFLVNGMPQLEVFLTAAHKYVRTSVVEKVLFMAFDEMERVKRLDVDTLAENSKRIRIVYGDRDGWAPAEWFEKMAASYPNLYVRNVPYQHAFCITAYKEMAVLTANLLQQRV